jgi:hypothetical protein
MRTANFARFLRELWEAEEEWGKEEERETTRPSNSQVLISVGD